MLDVNYLPKARKSCGELALRCEPISVPRGGATNGIGPVSGVTCNAASHLSVLARRCL